MNRLPLRTVPSNILITRPELVIRILNLISIVLLFSFLIRDTVQPSFIPITLEPYYPSILAQSHGLWIPLFREVQER